MELRWMRTFVAVATERNYRRAAISLHVSQPAVSQQIRKLEAEVGVQLLERSTRSVSLTPAGDAFLPLAMKTLKKADEAVRAARNSERDDHGIVRIGFAGAMGAPFVAEIARLVRQRHPGIELIFQAQLASGVVMDMLSAGDLDIGFTADARPVRGIRSRALRSDGFSVIMPTDHPLATAESLPLASLADETFVLLDAARGLRLREAAIDVCVDVGFRPRIVQDAPDTVTVFSLVSAGVGLSIVPTGFVTPTPGVADVPLSDVEREFSTVIAWRLSPGFGALRRVLAVIDEVFVDFDKQMQSP
jgi:DNA-binding transcriptional LysR family regulator